MAKYAGIAISREPASPVCGVEVLFDTAEHMKAFAKTYYSAAPEPDAVALCPNIRKK